MQNTVRFGAVAMPAGKEGVLRPDEDGYYTVVLGGMDVFNSVGEFYVYEQAKALFERNSNFMRRVRDGMLKIEVGHPMPEPGMTEEQYYRRIFTLKESNICGFIKDIWLDFDNYFDKNGKKMVAILGKIAPSGPHGQALRESLERPGEEVCFSIRSFTQDFRARGVRNRILREIITFDWVTEPGIHAARKSRSPALESYGDCEITKKMLLSIINQPQLAGVGMESSVAGARNLAHTLGWDEVTKKTKPAFASW